MLVKTSLAQDIEQSLKDFKNTFKQEIFGVTGTIGASSVFYTANGIAPRRDPFYWVLNANLNFSLFNKISVPFTAVFTQQNQTYTNGLDKYSKPFNQFGISPHYKWLTVHAGYRSVEFSEYTLSGALFLGGGVEIKPQKSLLSGAAIYGRFVKAVPSGGMEGVSVNTPAYLRMGGGVKLKVGTDVNFAEFIFLKIKDDVNSIPFDTALTSTPQENQILAIGTKQKLSRYFNTGFDFSYSFFSKNLFDGAYKLERFTYINQIYSPRPSSQFNKALNANIDFTPGKYTFGIKYKRIDPDYKTLGSVFLTNDVEEISLNIGAVILHNKINFNIASGLQHNNLDKIQILTSRRIIGSLNLSYSINEHFNLSANYSNFSSNTLPIKDAYSDSLKFIQLTENIGLSFNYVFGSLKFKHSISNTASYMESDGNKEGLTAYLNETFSYSLLLDELGVGLITSVIYNRATNEGFNTNEGLGPNLGIQKTLLKSKIKLILNIGFQNVYKNRQAINKNNTYTFNFNYTLDKHNCVKANISYLNKEARTNSVQQFSEIRAGLSYVYNFGYKLKTKLPL